MSSIITSRLQQILLIAIPGGLNLAVSLIALLWSKSRQILLPEPVKAGDVKDFSMFYNPLGDAAFGFGILSIILNVLTLAAPVLLYDANKGKVVASSNNSASSMNDFFLDYIVFFAIIAVMALIMLCVLAAIVNATYYCSATAKTFRIFGYIYNVRYREWSSPPPPSLWPSLSFYSLYGHVSARGESGCVSTLSRWWRMWKASVSTYRIHSYGQLSVYWLGTVRSLL